MREGAVVSQEAGEREVGISILYRRCNSWCDIMNSVV